MEEVMESEHSDIFGVELVTKNVVPGSSGAHFMHMRINSNIWYFHLRSFWGHFFI